MLTQLHSPFCLLSSTLLSSCSPTSIVSYFSENKSESIIWISQSTIFVLLTLFPPLQIEFPRSSQNYSLDTQQLMLLLYNCICICLFFRVIFVCGYPFQISAADQHLANVLIDFAFGIKAIEFGNFNFPFLLLSVN